MSTAIPPSTGDQWRIELFGGLRVRQGDQKVPRSLPRKSGSLLACLAFYRHRSHPREELMEMLWPDEDPDATRLRFRQVLTTLRRELDPSGRSVGDLIVADRSDVRLNPGAVTTDVDEFEAELKHAAKAPEPAKRAELLQKAVQQYGGALLPGFYDDWISRERQRLSEEYQDAIIQLADALAASGKMQQAIEYARKGVAADPIHEASACCLMRTLAAAGRRAEALKHFRILEQALWKELRVVPSEATRAVMESVRSGEIGKSGVRNGLQGAGANRVDEFEDDTVVEQETFDSGLDTSHGALPVSLNRFFGREVEMESLKKILDPGENDAKSARLVTLVGPGGAGKTRLALETAHRVQSAFSGSVWFVRLTGITDAGGLQTAIIEALGSQDSTAPGSLEQTIRGLGQTTGLLILDNFEQLADVGGSTVRAILERASGIRCLVTSRQRLNIEGEQAFEVQPLPVPGSNNELEGLGGIPSVRLFVDRSQKTRPGFALIDANSDAIAELCRRLDGIPLAIELAAGWAGALTPSQILDRLSHRFGLLVSRRKDLDERHRSLAATISWSYEQLPADLQGLFARLSVFRGGWTMEAAEAVCAEQPGNSIESTPAPASFFILDSLEHLRERSLIIAEPSGNEVRFRMLETLREFGEQNLDAAARSSIRQKHARYFCDLAETARSELVGPNQVQWLDRLDADIHNLRTAVAWTFGDGGDIDLGLRLFGSIWRFWDIRSHRPDAEWMWAQLSQRISAASPLARAKGLEGAACTAINDRDYEMGIPRLREALANYREEGDRPGIARSLCWLGNGLRDAGHITEGKTLLNESLAISEEMNDKNGAGGALAGLGGCANQEQDYAAARSYLDRAAAYFRICGNHRGLAWCMLNEAHGCLNHGDFALAEQRYREALALFRVLGDRTWIFLSLFFLAHLAQTSGDLEHAQARGEDALIYARQTRSATWEASFLTWLGDMASDRNELALGWRRYCEALKLSDERGIEAEQRSALGGMASLAAKQGRLKRAISLYACALQLDAPPSKGAHAWYLRDLDAALEELQRESDPDIFKSAWERGQAMTRNQAIVYAMADTSDG